MKCGNSSRKKKMKGHRSRNLMRAVPVPLGVMLHILKNKNILTLLIMISDESFDEIDKKKPSSIIVENQHLVH